MSRRGLSFFVLMLIWAAALSVAAAQTTEPRSSGVYTAEQAERGRNEYTTACAHCHASDLLGDVRQEIPSLADEDFMVRWGGRPASDLFKMISTDMPADKPGRLAASAYVDILAYILQTNGFPAGASELRPDIGLLAAIVIEKQP